MTEEEIEKAISEVKEKLAAIPDSEKKLSGKEWRQYLRLKQEEEILGKIQKARKTGDLQQEAKHTAHYCLFTDSKNMHPVLRYIMQLKIRSNIWI